MVTFILEHSDLFNDLVILALSVVGFIVTIIRTGNVKKSIDSFKEVEELKKTVESRTYRQSFTPDEKDYILNPATNELEEKPIPKNVQDYINSHIETCLERVLERFLPQQHSEEDNTIADYTQRVDDLASIGEAMELAEEYRDKFGLPDNYTMSQIYEAVDKSAKSLKDKLSEANKPKPEVKPEVKPEAKEVK